jgi:peptidyl-prolyl cis-trans isomerase SurA
MNRPVCLRSAVQLRHIIIALCGVPLLFAALTAAAQLANPDTQNPLMKPLAPPVPAARMETRLAAPAKPGGIVPLDRIVAVVNNDVITLNNLNERMATVVKQLQKQGTSLPPQDVLQKQLLERMINDLMQVQEASDTGVRVSDGELDKILQRIADENNLSMTDFRRVLEQDGMPWPRFREEIRNESIIGRLREREVEGNITVTEAEIDTQLALETREASNDQEFRLAHILVQVPEQATSAQIEARRKRAAQALTALRGGAEFAQISAQYSDAPDALQGGNLGWRPSGRLPAIFLEALNTMKAGDVSDIMRSANGFHIVKLLDKRGRSAAPGIQQTHVRHILLRLKEGVVNDNEARERLARLRERIIAGADFAELAKVHSDDPSSSKGGDLGWLSPGDTVPEFERTMNALGNNEISSPVQTQFGWHLVQVMERRTEGVSDERRRAAARNTIRARKADEAYQDWLRQTRDRAFVEYRLEEK